MISAIIITYNEEKNIGECIESLKSVELIDEILLIDSHSTDKTIEIAQQYSDKIIQTDLTSITEKRKLAFEKSLNNWILFLDADEMISEELKNEINLLNLSNNNEIAGYYINRRNFYFSKWIKHCGIYPDYHIRLFDKTSSAITERVIHEGVTVNGKTARLNNHIVHYTVSDFKQMIDKVNFFSTYEALEHFQNNKKISKFGVFTHSLSAFLRIFISRKGFMDGLPGFLVSIMDSMVNMLTHLKLLKMQRKI